ncbi:hypothetical protein A2368_01965 [Candidatus Collierbacteria bacterium RIFOXYB1_FULL_49_13]|uniref:Uncharacterized protein n=1 Tax=Candidatus Collierbacteria bacterium RIFOXYB1_FULL_49_13 TaxID=1817728 RepID=A0A1F5FGI4_9BACT|nr:MAG: hypothetical protein A2368_01965 [Candidatus Collierbacteria bacterium RIFOXYB1_FULL_49_13]
MNQPMTKNAIVESILEEMAESMPESSWDDDSHSDSYSDSDGPGWQDYYNDRGQHSDSWEDE